MRRFFYDTSSGVEAVSLSALSIGSDVALTEDIVHHWCRVLRANIGDEGVLFDGFGGEYQVRLQSIAKKRATVTLLAHETDDRTAPFISQIGLVMSRGERMDYAIQKATELGVTAIQLLSSQHGEVSLKPAQVDKKLLHWQQVAISACEQCGLNRPPLILSPMTIVNWLQIRRSDAEKNHSQDDRQNNAHTSHHSEKKLAVSPIVSALADAPYYHALHHQAGLRLVLSVPAENQPTTPLALASNHLKNQPYIELLIGAEGGLSQDELTLAAQSGFDSWQIGTRVLRTETAPVVALASLHAFLSMPSHK